MTPRVTPALLGGERAWRRQSREVRRQRLLDQDVGAGLGGQDRGLGVERVRGRQQDGLGPGLVPAWLRRRRRASRRDRAAKASARVEARRRRRRRTRTRAGSPRPGRGSRRPSRSRPGRSVRRRAIVRPSGKVLGDHPPEEGERLGHLVHAVHAVLDADPAFDNDGRPGSGRWRRSRSAPCRSRRGGGWASSRASRRPGGGRRGSPLRRGIGRWRAC